jgi:anaerobic carbon-monoxide dehydrogenase iron sulfur subunit
MSNIKEIFVKTEKCTGCQSCKLACAVAHPQSKNLFAALNETVKPKSRLYVEWLPGATPRYPYCAVIVRMLPV